ncbi:hypothetical protein K3740_08980 [Ruegeria conchae]|uniref:hypothetical protein n=1 Tax=Ruegeria conchae TaxID=981384 RepID=UPI0021A4069C|nr:hypothetical protein [Ruegeria conchae]UWR04791.1 hypothetical protein K3740_08980 [Ruegeria conchae]
MRYVTFFILFLALPVFAQNNDATAPQVSVEAPDEPVIVGQPAIVRIKVLVPTFMPQPPVFPSLEQQNLVVRLPERASGPISETVNGATWSGVQRSYRLYPLATGPVAFDSQEVVVTYADPQTNDPIQVSLALPPVQLSAEIPEGARGLDPLIIANGFSLQQQIEGTTDMQAGDAITRDLSAQISGTTPLLIPVLTPHEQDPLLRAYPTEPRITETEDRGVLSGQRMEKTVYIAQEGGQTRLPAVSIDWFNLQTKQIETASVPATELTLVPPKWQPPDIETLAKAAFWIAIVVLALWAAVRSLRPRYQRWKDKRHSRYLASEEYAAEALRAALRARDLSAAYDAIELWKERSLQPERAAPLESSLTQIGAERYSKKSQIGFEDWSAVMRNLNALNNSSRPKPGVLPPLNP